MKKKSNLEMILQELKPRPKPISNIEQLLLELFSPIVEPNTEEAEKQHAEDVVHNIGSIDDFVNDFKLLVKIPVDSSKEMMSDDEMSDYLEQRFAKENSTISEELTITEENAGLEEKSAGVVVTL